MKWLIALLLALLLLAVPVHSASYVNQFTLSSELHPGLYADYAAYLHPKVNTFRLEVASVLSQTLVMLNVTLNLDDYSHHSFLQLITVKGDNDTKKAVELRFDNGTEKLFLATASISIPQYEFYIAFPLVSPHLNPTDFLNLDERAKSSYYSTGPSQALQIQQFGGDIFDYAFRSVYISYVTAFGGGYQNLWVWDKSTGFIITYLNVLAQPYKFGLIDTNIFGSPSSAIYKPTNPFLLVNDVYLIFAMTGGLFFTHWELWALCAGIVISHFFQAWLRRYYEDRKRILGMPQLHKLLKRVESQDKKVLYLRD